MLCTELASSVLALGLGISDKEAKDRVAYAISSGIALEKMKEWIGTQGGDVSFICRPKLLINANGQKKLVAKCDGYISAINAELCGVASMLLGAGRSKKDDEIDSFAGIELLCEYGQYVKYGTELAIMYASDSSLFDNAEKTLENAFEFSDSPAEKKTLIKKII